MTECQEPGCNHPAVKDWNGRKVCADHYDIYRDANEKRIREMSY